MEYRQVLYQNYFKNHLGKRSGLEYKIQFEKEKKQFKNDLEPILSKLKKEGQYFDSGCGTGSLLITLLELGFKNLSGVDISSEQIEVAKSFGLNQVEQGDALSFLKTTKKKFDGIFAMDFIEHLSKNELIKYFYHIQESLQHEGFLICRTPNADAPISSIYSYGDASHETIFNKKSLEQFLLSCGFKEVLVFPSSIYAGGGPKAFIRRILYPGYLFLRKFSLFLNGYSNKEVLHSPNLVVYARK